MHSNNVSDSKPNSARTGTLHCNTEIVKFKLKDSFELLLLYTFILSEIKKGGLKGLTMFEQRAAKVVLA